MSQETKDERNESRDYWRDMALNERELRGRLGDVFKDTIADLWPYLPTDFRDEYLEATRKAVEENHAHPDAWRFLAGVELAKRRECTCRECAGEPKAD